MKVYVLVVEDMFEGVNNVSVKVFKEFNLATKEFKKLIKKYKDENNNFDNYDIDETDTYFRACEEGEYVLNHLDIDILETDLIEN